MSCSFGLYSSQPSVTSSDRRTPSRIERHVQDEIAQAVERDPFAAAVDHSPRPSARLSKHMSYFRSCSSELERVLASPRPVLPQSLLDRLGLPLKVIASGLMSGVIRPTRSSGPRRRVRRSMSRSVDVVRARNADVAGVEKNHEHAAVRVGRERVRLGRRLRFDALVLGAARAGRRCARRFRFSAATPSSAT